MRALLVAHLDRRRGPLPCCRNSLNDLLFRETCSSRAPSGFFPQRPVDHPFVEPLYSSHSTAEKTGLRPGPPHRNLRGVPSLPESNCLGGLLLLLRTNVESSKRKMKVHVADRWVLMPDHDLFGFPGKKASEDRVSIVIWRD